MIKDYAKMLAEQQSLIRAQPTSMTDTSEWQPTGKLVNEDGNVRFVDSPLLGVIYEEVRPRASVLLHLMHAYTVDPSDRSEP